MIVKRSCWLIFDVNDIARMYRRDNRMTIGVNERVIKVNIKYDTDLFKTPTYETTVNVGSQPEINIDISDLEKEIRKLKESNLK
jgi:hypothetical protein